MGEHVLLRMRFDFTTVLPDMTLFHNNRKKGSLFLAEP